jgi:hypothetical protein
MLLVLLIGAVVGVIVLCFFLVVELNELEKGVAALVEKTMKHYESQ